MWLKENLPTHSEHGLEEDKNIPYVLSLNFIVKKKKKYLVDNNMVIYEVGLQLSVQEAMPRGSIADTTVKKSKKKKVHNSTDRCVWEIIGKRETHSFWMAI